MKKNVKGFISLFTGIAAVIFIILAFAVRTAKIKGSDTVFYSFKNVGFAGLAFLFGVVALIFGILSIKGGREKMGPRKSGLILAIVMIIVSFFSFFVTAFFAAVTDYANRGEKSFVYESIKNDADSKKFFDDFVKELRK